MRLIKAFPDSDGNCCEDMDRESPCDPCTGPEFSWENDCSDFSVQFTDETEPEGTAVSWDWDFGDGDTSTDQNPNHTYAEGGDYDVALCINGSPTNCVTHAVTVAHVCEDPDNYPLVIYSQDASDIGLDASGTAHDPMLVSLGNSPTGVYANSTGQNINCSSGLYSANPGVARLHITGVRVNPFTLTYDKSDAETACPLGSYSLVFNGTSPHYDVATTLEVTCSL